MQQNELVTAFRQLHRHQQPLVLPNAWDPVSARVIERSGARAIATTSAGVSWALGRKDGQGLSRSQAMAATRAIVEVVQVPVTADIERGYGSGSPADVAETVSAALEAGVVGINLEDASGKSGQLLVTPEEQADRIFAAREAARAEDRDLFINARTDIYLAGVGEPTGRLEAVLERAAMYLEAGADGVFVPAVRESDVIAALVNGIDGPLNIMAGPGGLSIQEVARLGVARVSLGPAVMLGSLGWLERATQEVLGEGTYDALEPGLTYSETNDLFPNA